ncbi:TPA: protein Eaa, partial [Escherichia coli]|nr:protein Eaa [Escherichia coli]HDX5048567.1 protein Eaa [Escherichia coli]
MAEFTKEQLIEELERRLAVTTHYPDFEEAQLDAQIFKIALEALTAGME